VIDVLAHGRSRPETYRCAGDRGGEHFKRRILEPAREVMVSERRFLRASGSGHTDSEEAMSSVDPDRDERRMPPYAPWVVLAGALSLGVLQGMQVFVSFALEGERITLAHAMVTVVSWLLMAALLPIPLLISKRFPLDSGGSVTAWAAHIGGGLLFAFLHLAANAAYHDARTLSGFTSQFLFLVRFFFILDFVTYLAAILAIHAWRYSRALRERERRAMVLERELVEARLDRLRAQLNPHFLFNTLNALASLAETAPAEKLADGIAKLAELLRLSLDDHSGPETSLRSELEAVRTYSEIQQLRFGERLAVTTNVDPAILNAAVPTLILQPIVENAIEHGRPPPGEKSEIQVSARREGDRLILAVEDRGPGFSPEVEHTEGIGLAAVSARLEHMYGDESDISFGRSSVGGASVQIRLPYVVRPSRVGVSEGFV